MGVLLPVLTSASSRQRLPPVYKWIDTYTMKKNLYRVIIHADLTEPIDLTAIRRLPDVESAYEIRGQSLLIFAGGDDAETCYQLVAKLKKMPGICLVKPHYLFS